MSKTIQIRVNQQLKQQVDAIFEDIGLDTPTAIRIFLKKVASTRAIPFTLKSSITDNGFTEEFENDVLNAAQEEEQIGPFNSAKEAISALHKSVE